MAFSQIALFSLNSALYQRRLVRGAIDRGQRRIQAHCNGWNGINGMVPNTSNKWKH
jgi:hypothetical protein